jgi:hypothetical protein
MTRYDDYLKEFSAYGYTCRVLGGPFKNYNGYVGVPKGHPAFNVQYENLGIDVHGGLTFSQMGTKNSLRFPNPEIWWIGFDTAHIGDWIEYQDGTHPESNGKKWTPEMVAEECSKVAKQLMEMVK